MEKRLWSGSPQSCDICKSDSVKEVFIDGATYQGPWAILCLKCFAMHGVGLGTGKGQKYELSNGEYVKIAG
jgi:hypothetical protein